MGDGLIAAAISPARLDHLVADLSPGTDPTSVLGGLINEYERAA